MTEDKMVGWHHRLDSVDGSWSKLQDMVMVKDRGNLVCCSSWGCKESDMTERLNWTELKET